MSAQQTAACLFMWTAAPMFSAAAYLPTFMLERSLFRRERSDGIFNVLTYYTAKVRTTFAPQASSGHQS